MTQPPDTQWSHKEVTMSKFEQWLAGSPLGSAAKIFVSFILTAVLLTWTNDGSISFDKWQTWVIGALGVSVPVIINWLNKEDARYGKKKQ